MALSSAGLVACQPTCSAPERIFSGGTRDLTRALYETSAPDGPFLSFEGGAVLRIQHRVGFRPVAVLVYLSFNEKPEAEGGGGAAPAAGNQAVIMKQDETEVVIKNDSCASYYVRVVVVGGSSAFSSDAGLQD